MLAFEATLTSEVAEKAAAFTGIAHRIRIMGSLALSLCHLAAGRLDARLLAEAVPLGGRRRRPAARRASAGSRSRTSTARAFADGAARPRPAFTHRRRGNCRAVPTRGQAVYPRRLLRLELRALAERRVLSAAASRVEVARALRAVLRHRRGERDVLPPAEALVGRALGGAVAAGVRLRDQGVALPDAHQAAERPRPRARALLRVHRAAARLAEARADPLAAAAELQARRRAARRSARAAADASSATRSSSATRAGSTPTSTPCCASIASRS